MEESAALGMSDIKRVVYFKGGRDSWICGVVELTRNGIGCSRRKAGVFFFPNGGIERARKGVCRWP